MSRHNHRDWDGDQGRDAYTDNLKRAPEHPLPMQPIVFDGHATEHSPLGGIRYRENRLVSYLLDKGGLDLNDVALYAALNKVSNAEQMQLAQLIGYSVDGAADLSYFDNETKDQADEVARALWEKAYGAEWKSILPRLEEKGEL